MEMMSVLGADHVLRRNIRVIMDSKDYSPTPFVKSTFGSHHLLFIDYTARLWNAIIDRQDQSQQKATGLLTQEQASKAKHTSLAPKQLPILQDVLSEETFGAVASQHAATFGGLLPVKDEIADNPLDLALAEGEFHQDILRDLEIDVALVNVALVNTPEQQPVINRLPTVSPHESDSLINIDPRLWPASSSRIELASAVTATVNPELTPAVTATSNSDPTSTVSAISDSGPASAVAAILDPEPSEPPATYTGFENLPSMDYIVSLIQMLN